MARTDSKKDMPWSVKGVSKEAREVVKKAAAEQGVTMGEWLSQAIRADLDGSRASKQVVEDTMVAEPPATTRGAGSRDAEESLRRGIAEKIAESETRILNVVEPLQEIIQQMALRIELLEDRSAAAVKNNRPKALDGPPRFRKTGWDD